MCTAGDDLPAPAGSWLRMQVKSTCCDSHRREWEKRSTRAKCQGGVHWSCFFPPPRSAYLADFQERITEIEQCCDLQDAAMAHKVEMGSRGSRRKTMGSVD
eukprot:768545-Hanusia_phi.AAC.4